MVPDEVRWSRPATENSQLIIDEYWAQNANHVSGQLKNPSTPQCEAFLCFSGLFLGRLRSLSLIDSWRN